MKVHIFFIGRTGARIYRSFVHCLASGIFSGFQKGNIEFCSYTVDSDITNSDGEKARETSNLYQNIHQDFYSDIIKSEDSPLFSIPLHHHNIQIPDTLKESELFNASMFSEKTRLFFSALLGDELFKSNGIVNNEFLTYLAMSSVELKDFENKYAPQEDKVILIGSTFGVTGYSCLPQLASRIVKIIRNDKSIQINPRVAMVCVGPYFEVNRHDGCCYRTFRGRHAIFDYYCHKVIKEQMYEMSHYNILPIDRPDHVEYFEEGINQCYPAHVVELCAVSAIIDFIKKQKTERCDLSLKLEPKWPSVIPDDLPKVLRHGIDNLLCFYIWCCHFGKRPSSNDETITRYAEDFCHWLQEMGQHDISFCPIDFDSDKLSHSFRWYIPKKKFGIFNSDPLSSKKLDSLYRKETHTLSNSFTQKSKDFSIQYKVCSSAWELFKNSCRTETSQLRDNEWGVSRQESFILYDIPENINLSLPTLFSRLWLCDFAFFTLVSENLHHYDFSRCNYVSFIASECLDLLDFLFDYSDHPDLKIKKISINSVVQELKGSISLKHNQIAKTLYDDINHLPSKFAESDICIFLFRGHVIGGTSPFSLVFTSPQIKKLFYSWSSEFGYRFFDTPVSFERREPRFQKYLLSVMATLHHSNSIFRYVYSLINESRNTSFDGIDVYDVNSLVHSFQSNYIPIVDDNHHNVTVRTDNGAEIILGREPAPGCAAHDNRFDSGIYCSLTKSKTYLPEIDGCEKSEEIIYSSIFAPAEVRQKSHMLIQLFLHLKGESEWVCKLAQESDKNAERRDYIPLQCKLKKGDKVDVLLNIYGETLLMSDKKSIVWHGSFTKCSFYYFVPKDIDVDELSCVALLFVNGVPVGEMRFITQIVEVPRQLNPMILAHKYSKVFISYSHLDESKVKFLHEGLELGSVPHFFDRNYLKAGDIFPQVIQDYINSADLFILCWSENASKSEYVQKERLQALERAFPQVKPEQEAKLRIYPLSIEPRAELPSDMKENYHFGEI